LFTAVEGDRGMCLKNVHRMIGWSLAELLCVILIISIPAAICLGVIAGYLHMAKDPWRFLAAVAGGRVPNSLGVPPLGGSEPRERGTPSFKLGRCRAGACLDF